MAYTPKTRSQLRAALARDLRDPNLKTFTATELNDLLDAATVEVSRIYPKQDVQELAVTTDRQEQFPCAARSLFRVEVVRDGTVVSGIPNGSIGDHSQSGWDLHGGTLWLPLFARNGLTIDSSPTIRVWGYFDREIMASDTDTADTDAEAEYALRTYATLSGYQRLQNDRVLFQQWLTNTGNSDVSPNQLAQTADMYQSQWREQRQRLRSLQRV